MNQSYSSTWYVLGPIPIPYENCDELIHLPPFYFCSAPDCPCHNDPELTAELQRRVQSGEIDGAQALNLYWNQH